MCAPRSGLYTCLKCDAEIYTQTRKITEKEELQIKLLFLLVYQ